MILWTGEKCWTGLWLFLRGSLGPQGRNMAESVFQVVRRLLQYLNVNFVYSYVGRNKWYLLNSENDGPLEMAPQKAHGSFSRSQHSKGVCIYRSLLCQPPPAWKTYIYCWANTISEGLSLGDPEYHRQFLLKYIPRLFLLLCLHCYVFQLVKYPPLLLRSGGPRMSSWGC